MTDNRLRLAFEPELAVLPIRSLLPLRQVTDRIRRSHKYRVIAASIDEIGIIEPLVVFHKPDQRGCYLLLDGLLRLDILLTRGEAEVECLLALHNEAYTYNKMAIRLSIVQEHFMIQRAIERGVPEERIARALNVRVAHIKQRRKILRGICTKAVHLLSDKSVNPATFDILRKMREPRQIEACELMVAASNYASSYARALLAATPNEGLLQPLKRTIPAVVTAADLALMERELNEMQKRAVGVETSYGRDMLDLAITARYISELLNRRTIARYLVDNHPELAKEFRSILSATLVEPSTSSPSRGDVRTP